MKKFGFVVIIVVMLTIVFTTLAAAEEKKIDQIKITGYLSENYTVEGNIRQQLNAAASMIKKQYPDHEYRFLISGYTDNEGSNMVNVGYGFLRAFHFANQWKQEFPNSRVDYVSKGKSGERVVIIETTVIAPAIATMAPPPVTNETIEKELYLRIFLAVVLALCAIVAIWVAGKMLFRPKKSEAKKTVSNNHKDQPQRSGRSKWYDTDDGYQAFIEHDPKTGKFYAPYEIHGKRIEDGELKRVLSSCRRCNKKKEFAKMKRQLIKARLIREAIQSTSVIVLTDVVNTQA